MKTERTPQLFRFVAGKIGHDHGDLEHLLLKQRDAERAAEHRFEPRIEICDWLATGAPRQIRMHHIALNRSRPNDRDFDHNIVKTFWFHPRQRRHLRPALDLKHTDGVGFLHDCEGGGVIFRNMGQIERSPAFSAQFKGVLHNRHHAEPKQIYFHNAEIFAIVLVPLRHGAARHRRIFQWHKRTQFVLADDHAAGMLAEMARQSVDRLVQIDERRHARVFFGQPGLLDLRLQIERVRKIAVGKEMRKTIENARRKI